MKKSIILIESRVKIKIIDKANKMKILSTGLGMVLIALGLFAFAYFAVTFSDTISLPRGDLTLAEANVECELKETNSRWAYDGGFDDCVVFHVGKLTAAEAKIECELMEANSKGTFSGGVDACEVFYTSGKKLGLNSQYNFEIMRWSAFLSFVFTFLGGLLLYYSERPNKEKL